tara:strand:- start:1854 stop:2120 length:267 start_codon:yes stop_codon:yes gene_type:complete
MNNLPDDVIINIMKYLNFWNKEILVYRIINKRYELLSVQKFNMKINSIIVLKNESFLKKAIFCRKLNRCLIKKLEKDNIEMLLKQGWL